MFLRVFFLCIVCFCCVCGVSVEARVCLCMYGVRVLCCVLECVSALGVVCVCVCACVFERMYMRK